MRDAIRLGYTRRDAMQPLTQLSPDRTALPLHRPRLRPRRDCVARPPDGRGGTLRRQPAAQTVRSRHHGHRGARRPRRRRRQLLPFRAGRRGARRRRSRGQCAASTSRTPWSTTPSCAGDRARSALPAGLASGDRQRTRFRGGRRAPTPLRCDARASLDGDVFRLTGRKLWITNAPRLDSSSSSRRSIPRPATRASPAFLVERDFPGSRVGKKEDKLGIRASSTCELILDDCRVPKANVLGEIGKGYKIAIETLNEGRIGIGAQMIGLARAPGSRRRVHQRAQAVRQADRRLPGGAVPVRASWPPSSRPRA